MPTISVITATYQPPADYLLAAWESVRSQQLPESWTLEWLVQEDGREGRRASEILPEHPVIHCQGGRHGGVAITRNLALSRAQGSLVKNLDQDDLLGPGALARDIATFTEHPHIGWVTSHTVDLFTDGTTKSPTDPRPPGPIDPGDLATMWRERDHILPVHPASMCLRRDLAVALGGWMAVPGSDDTGLLIAASTVAPGFFLPDTGLFVRHWPGQASAPDGPHYEPTERAARMRLISDRAALMAAFGWSPSLTAADPEIDLIQR